MKSALCPYCYDGKIVKCRVGCLFCNECFKEIIIRDFINTKK